MKHSLPIISALAMAAALLFSPMQGYAQSHSSTASIDAAKVTNAFPAMDQSGLVTEESAPQHHEDVAGVEAGQEEGKDGLPQLKVSTYPSQIFWLLVMFVVLYTAFSKSLLPMIGGVVNARDSMIKGNLDDAQSLKDRAQAIKTEYERNLDIAKSNATKAVQDVELASKKKAAEQIESFRQKADSEIAKTEGNVMSAKDKAMGEMNSVAAEVASQAAEKITGISTDRQKAHAIVESIAEKAKAA